MEVLLDRWKYHECRARFCLYGRLQSRDQKVVLAPLYGIMRAYATYSDSVAVSNSDGSFFMSLMVKWDVRKAPLEVHRLCCS